MRPFLLAVSRGPWGRASRDFPARETSSYVCFRCYATSHTHTSSIRLDLQAIDTKWQKRWEKGRSGQDVSRNGQKAYILAMFPYPSGALHMGHLRVYTITDVLARFKQMQGYEVLHPMGWDAFGLPAENAAIERGIDPAQWTAHNVANMKAQLKAMNSGLDWSREFMTCDPEFYKHTQHIFLLLHQAGLAYQAEALVNYDPIDRTVLANEQVDANGYSWRSGAKVEQLNLKQWFLKITQFRDALLDDIELLRKDGGWPDRVLAMQKHWLGKSEGASIRFPVGNDVSIPEPGKFVEVFTTRPDTLFGAQYIALSASHPLVKSRAAHDPNLNAFIQGLPSLPSDSKTGFHLSDLWARNPVSFLPGAASSSLKPLPVFVAPYVIDGYGSGAVMGVPGHDARDYTFWKENRPSDPVHHVIQPPESDIVKPIVDGTFTAPGVLNSRCGDYKGLTSSEASKKIIVDLKQHSQWASSEETWRLRDWLISRQRYWGTPIPIIHCGSCGAVPVPVEQLPVELPNIEDSWMKHKSGNPLESAEDWINVPCPKCNGPAKRDTDTMDTFACSSWYMFRFVDPQNDSSPFSKEKSNSTMPVDVYVGGIEHAILHLLYARFISKFLASVGLWPEGQSQDIRGEPFRRLLSQGMVHGKTFSDPHNGRFLKPEEIDFSDPLSPKIWKTGQAPHVSFEKMSKSKYNGIDPSDFIAKYGADVTRAHILFQAPVSEVLEWDEERIVGVQRWFQKIWRLVLEVSDSTAGSKGPEYSPGSLALSKDEAALMLTLQETVRSLNHALSTTYSLNTCISDLMQLTNALASSTTVQQHIGYYVLNNLLRLMAPFAPAFSAECWEKLHTSSEANVQDIFSYKFPEFVETDQLKSTNQTCAIMENGKLRFAIEIEGPKEDIVGDKLEQFVLDQIQRTEQGKNWLSTQNKKWKRIVVVKGGKTVNFVA